MTKTITLPYPISANRYWRVNKQTGTIYRSKEAKTYIEDTGWAMLRAGWTEPALETVSVRLRFMHDAGRRIDLDNGIKIVLDALQGFAYADDKQVVYIEAELVVLPRKVTPFVEVVIAPREARMREA